MTDKKVEFYDGSSTWYYCPFSGIGVCEGDMIMQTKKEYRKHLKKYHKTKADVED